MERVNVKTRRDLLHVVSWRKTGHSWALLKRKVNTARESERESERERERERERSGALRFIRFRSGSLSRERSETWWRGREEAKRARHLFHPPLSLDLAHFAMTCLLLPLSLLYHRDAKGFDRSRKTRTGKNSPGGGKPKFVCRGEGEGGKNSWWPIMLFVVGLFASPPGGGRLGGGQAAVRIPHPPFPTFSPSHTSCGEWGHGRGWRMGR